MKKILLIAGVMFLSTAILTSCGSKDEKKEEDKKEEKKEEAKDGEVEEAEASAPTGAWTEEVQNAYVNSCFQSAKAGMKEDVAKEYCDCTLGKIMDKYPDPAALANLGQDEITSLAMQCMTSDMMMGK